MTSLVLKYNNGAISQRPWLFCAASLAASQADVTCPQAFRHVGKRMETSGPEEAGLASSPVGAAALAEVGCYVCLRNMQRTGWAAPYFRSP